MKWSLICILFVWGEAEKPSVEGEAEDFAMKVDGVTTEISLGPAPAAVVHINRLSNFILISILSLFQKS